MASTLTYDQVGIREDLSDTIWDVSPEEVPFSSNCAHTGVDNTKFEWQTDSLDAVQDETAVEGADATFTAADPTVRLQNYTEINEKTAQTSGTLEATDRAGRGREMAYQVVKRAKEIKRDFEHHLVGVNQIADNGTANTDGRHTASYTTWISDATYVGTGTAATGDGTDITTDGAQTPFLESMLEEVIDAIWTEGGDPDIIMAGSFNKRTLTGFAGNSSEQNLERSTKKIINAVSVYESDYGTMKVVPNRFVRSRDVLVYQSSFWKIGDLRGMQNKEIAKTGDSNKRQVLMEAGLMACNNLSSGIIADLTTA